MANEVFVLTLPLKVEKWQADILDKRYELLRQVYNMVQQKLVRQYIYFSQQKAFKDCKTFQQKREFFESHPFQIKIDGEPCKITFPPKPNSGKTAPNSIFKYVSKLGSQKVGENKTLTDLGINSIILEDLGLRILRAWEDRLYNHKTRHISRREYGDVNTLVSRYIKSSKTGNVCFPGFTINLEEGYITYKYNTSYKLNKNGKQKEYADLIKLYIDYSHEKKGYAKEALIGGLANIREISIVRRCIRGKNKYYLQLTINGNPPKKGRILGKGTVGIDIGPSSIAISSLHGVHYDKLADKCDNIEHDLYLLNRKLDRSRRANNPQNYNEDGSNKQFSRQKGEQRVWNESNRYKQLKLVRKELYRRQADIRKHQHIELANALLSQGDTFIVENNPIDAWARRTKETAKTKTGKNRCKKRYGKSIAHHAPAMFVTILENKVRSLGGDFSKVDTSYAASQFDFTNGKFTKHSVSERSITLSNGHTHQRDMLSAFNLQHARLKNENAKSRDKEKKVESYDIEQMQADYPIFCKLEAIERERFKVARLNERDALYLIGASEKQMRCQPQEKSVANRHIGGVGRKHCNTRLEKENAEITGSGLARESIARVSQVLDEYHQHDHQSIIIDGL